MDGRVFCVHGGLSPNLHTIDQVCPFRYPVLYRKCGDFLHRRSVVLTENKKFRTTDPCATSFGLTLMVSFTATCSFGQIQTLAFHVSRDPRMGTFSSWCRLSIWSRYYKKFRSHECYRSNRKGTPARYGRLQTHVRSNNCHCLECTKLLLPVCSLFFLLQLAKRAPCSQSDYVIHLNACQQALYQMLNSMTPLRSVMR